jgi:hypothetical protein
MRKQLVTETSLQKMRVRNSLHGLPSVGTEHRRNLPVGEILSPFPFYLRLPIAMRLFFAVIEFFQFRIGTIQKISFDSIEKSINLAQDTSHLGMTDAWGIRVWLYMTICFITEDHEISRVAARRLV